MMPDDVLSELSRSVAMRLGLHFPPRRWAELQRGVTAAARELGHADASAWIATWPVSPLGHREIGALAAHLTVGETYFFRDAGTWSALEHSVLPALIRARGEERRLRLWSAGCAGGDEPYSLAILLDRLIPDLHNWHITILATDINARSVRRAKAGIYSEWSFRSMPAWIRSAYFRKRAGGYELAPRIRRMVSFGYLNLAEDTYPDLATNTNAMDLVLCRNVLMYFSPEAGSEAAGRLHRSLSPDGWLIVSPSELSQSLFAEFECVRRDDALLYRKRSPERAHGTAWQEQAERAPWPMAAAVEAAWEADSLAPAPPEAVAFPDEAAPPTPPPAESANERFARRHEELRALLRSGRYAEARNALAALVAGGCADARCYALLARVSANEGQLSEALVWCDGALRRDKMRAAYHYLRAVILEESGQTQEAILALRRTLYLDPSFVLAHFALGGLAARVNDARARSRHRLAALALLQNYRDDEVVPESEGIIAGQLAEMIATQEARG